MRNATRQKLQPLVGARRASGAPASGCHDMLAAEPTHALNDQMKMNIKHSIHNEIRCSSKSDSDEVIPNGCKAVMSCEWEIGKEHVNEASTVLLH